jgi:hypothetical protein
MRIEYSQDVEDIRPLAQAWFAKCRADGFGLRGDLEWILQDLQSWLNQYTGTLLLAQDEDRPVGFFAVFALPSYLSGELVALEKYWYADPNSVFAGPKLYVMARRWAIAAGCRHLIIAASHLAGDDHDKVANFCRSAGMRLFETTYIERLEP